MRRISRLPTSLKRCAFATTTATAMHTTTVMITSCTLCHSSFDLYDDRVSAFITLNTENYHRLHVEGQRIGCVECHDPHGSSQQALIRRTLITGELMTYMPTGRGASCSVTCHGATHDSLEYVNRLP